MTTGSLRRIVYGLAACLPFLISVLSLSACDDRAELPRKGFVMGVALDATDRGSIQLSVQFFKPSQSVTGKGKSGRAYINVRTEDQSVIEAVRDITIHLGRKAQWSHMRVILVGEELARQMPLLDVLEFFYRDHEPRLTSHILITKGRAADYLNVPPYIENTISQQYFQSEQAAHQLSGKTSRIDLLDLALQARSESGTALLPYLYVQNEDRLSTPNIAGAAVLAQGRVRTIVPSQLLEGLLTLRNDYRSGILEVPCEGKFASPHLLQEDAAEVLQLQSRMTVKVQENRLHLIFRAKGYVAISEMVCGKTLTPDEEVKLRDRVQRSLEQAMGESADWMLEKRLDLVGAGNRLHETNPRLWKTWKEDWPSRFGRSSYEVHAEITIVTTGTNAGKPIRSEM